MAGEESEGHGINSLKARVFNDFFNQKNQPNMSLRRKKTRTRGLTRSRKTWRNLTKEASNTRTKKSWTGEKDLLP